MTDVDNKVTVQLGVILFVTLLLPQLVSAKRIGPVKVDPVIYDGIRYIAPNDDGRRGYVEAWTVGTDKKLWELIIFTNATDPNLEEDVQWVFIKSLNIQDGRLLATSERGENYQVDLKTKEITQSNSRSAPSAEPVSDVPDAVKKALTNGSAGKKYDLSFRMKPSYLEGDFDGDGKMDTAVLIKERSTGKVWDCDRSWRDWKGDNPRGRQWHRQRWRRLRMDGFLAGLFQNACCPMPRRSEAASALIIGTAKSTCGPSWVING